MERVFKNFPFVTRTRAADLTRHHERVRPIVLAEHAAWTAPEGQYSFPIQSPDPFFTQLYERFGFACLSAFEPFTLHASSRRHCWAFVQKSGEERAIWHDHILTSTIVGVYYLCAPGEGGALGFRYREQEFQMRPEEGWIYLFPRWLLHKPMPQRTPEHRISLNVEMITRECPLAREGGWRW